MGAHLTEEGYGSYYCPGEVAKISVALLQHVIMT